MFSHASRLPLLNPRRLVRSLKRSQEAPWTQGLGFQGFRVHKSILLQMVMDCRMMLLLTMMEVVEELVVLVVAVFAGSGRGAR